MAISNGSEKMSGDDEKTVYLVTGATGAIGYAIARQLANRQNSKVVLVCRNADKARQAVKTTFDTTGNSDVDFKLADLGRHSDITALADAWSGPLHVLINNAAITPRTRELTPEGIERQFATNVLGYFWMIDAFTDILSDSAPARIINVASYWAGGLDLKDLEFRHRHYHNDTAYRQSKQANRMLSVAFAEKLKPHNITVNSCHPGDVNSTLSNDLGFGGHESPDQGAETPVWLATTRNGQNNSGCYFEHRRESRCAFGENAAKVKQLFDICSGY